MKVTFSVEVDPDDRQVLAVYVKMKRGPVRRTVEVAEGKCYVDEDANGELIGAEMLAPGKLMLLARKVDRRYGTAGMARAVKSVQEALVPA